MESCMDEMCAEVKNTALSIAELIAFMKRGVETSHGALSDAKTQQLGASKVPGGPEVALKPEAHSK